MPNKTVCAQDVRTQSLCHEDTGRRHQNQDRPPVCRAISGPQLGAAAHCFVVNSLQLKSSSSGRANHIVQQLVQGMSSSFLSSKHQNVSPKPRPAGPQGFEKGFHLSGGQVSNDGMHKSQQNAKSAALVDDHVSTQSTPNRKAKNKRGHRKETEGSSSETCHFLRTSNVRKGGL